MNMNGLKIKKIQWRKNKNEQPNGGLVMSTGRTHVAISEMTCSQVTKICGCVCASSKWKCQRMKKNIQVNMKLVLIKYGYPHPGQKPLDMHGQMALPPCFEWVRWDKFIWNQMVQTHDTSSLATIISKTWTTCHRINI